MDTYEEDVFDITDERDLEALAHPIRMRLLTMLRADGPSTASKLAARVGESSGLTSYHLRQLAERGFIGEAPDLGTKRERWWKAEKHITRYSPANLVDSPSARRSLTTIRRHVLGWQQLAALTYLSEEPEWGPDWADAAGHDDLLLHLNPDQLRDMTGELLDIIKRYLANPAGPEDRRAADVLVFVNAFPVREVPL
ncbi:MAG: helix-turn-helix domain-containing protein [Acidimicrobiia bacterium]|nr:helix-turn-helix domain-containing protein [Acidimicrobiia bacterium]